MYIQYITPQRVADPNITEYHSNGGDYRPTYLIRTSDWKKVPGHEAINGYQALSYCWEQSGEKFQKEDGEYDLRDDGHHRITKIKKVKPRISNLFRKETTETHQVTYNQLLQQICKDFDIEYLWYDKICIDQTNKEEKKREIKQMHLIYSNARFTVAVVPEINIEDPSDFDYKHPIFRGIKALTESTQQMKESLWWKRSWTLEEVMMSTRILVTGRNIHFWSLADIKQGKTIKESDEMANHMLGFQDRKMKSASQVLYYAHQRTSTKEHDKIFALANILHGMICIDIDYDYDFSAVMNSFYRQLVQRDLSIMCFGATVYPWSGKPERATTMSFYNLPSWTGIAGRHPTYPVIDIALGEDGFYSVEDSMDLHIRCRSYTIRPTQNYDFVFYLDDTRIIRAGKNYLRVINSLDDFRGGETEALDWIQCCMTNASLRCTHYAMRDAACCSPVLPLSLTESCDECIVLGVLFAIARQTLNSNAIVGKDYFYFSPIVVKSSVDSPVYKVIGVILLRLFQYDEPRKSPEEFMNEMFDQLGHSEYQDFCIK